MNEDFREGTPLTFDEYQQAIKGFYIFPEETHEQYALLGLVAEVGEITGHLAKFLRDAPADEDEADEAWAEVVLPKVRKEIGDVQFLLTCLADAYGWDMAVIAQENLDKLHSRRKRGVIQGSGDDR